MNWHRLWPGRAIASIAPMVALGTVLCASPGIARAEAPGPGASAVHVVGMDTDDADEQADAFTAVLRARLKEMPGFSLGDSQQALGMLTTAMKCKGKQPDGDCEQKIATQLSAERFIWGTVQKSKGQATVELHLFRRGKGSSPPVRETYPDSLKDPRDPALQKLVGNLLGQLLGVPTAQPATARIRANNYDCPVAVDGERKGELDHGALQVEVGPGPHTFELLKPCVTVKKTVTISAGGSALVDLSGATTTPPKETGGSGTNVRPIVGWSLVGVGAASMAFSSYFGIRYLNNRSEAQDKWAAVPNDNKKVFVGVSADGSSFDAGRCSSAAAKPATGAATDRSLCDANTNATTNSTVFWVASSVGAAMVIGGVIVLVTGDKEDKQPLKGRVDGPRNLQLAPVLGSTPGAVLSGEF
ncbi:MAG: hypothetical protein HOO96_20695 [Polyangiaceae bacterium]|nr:hypothetical protein [Polyangiaceae bacterium]